jgi:hypothetical protein
MIPTMVYLHEPSEEFVRTMLVKMRLSSTSLSVSMAACILDSLKSNWAFKWRDTCPKSPEKPTFELICGRYEPRAYQGVRPEILVIAGIAIASEFLGEDAINDNEYIDTYGQGWWSAEQLNMTRASIYHEVKDGLAQFADDETLRETIRDMHSAAAAATKARRPPIQPIIANVAGDGGYPFDNVETLQISGPSIGPIDKTAVMSSTVSANMNAQDTTVSSADVRDANDIELTGQLKDFHPPSYTSQYLPVENEELETRGLMMSVLEAEAFSDYDDCQAVCKALARQRSASPPPPS